MAKQENRNILSRLTSEHYELMHKTNEYWVNRALRGGTDFTVEDIREDINWLYEHVGDMGTNTPHIFLYDSYATMQLGYNLLRVIATEDKYKKLNKDGKNILKNPSMDRLWDLVWFGEKGLSIHESLDKTVSREVQEKIWEITARNTGDGVGMQIWDVVRTHLSSNMADVIWTNLWKNIAIPGAKQIRSKITERVWQDALQQLAAYTGTSVGERVTRQLESALEAMIAKSEGKLQFMDHFVGIGNWAGWMSFYDFFYQAGIITEEDGGGVTEEWKRFRRLVAERGIWTMGCYDDCVIVCKLPKRVRRDEVGRNLHSLAGPAIEWLDGTGQYFIHGINFSESFLDSLGTPPVLWERITSGKISWSELFAIRNIEQRRVAIRVYGPERIMKDAKAELIDRSTRGNELYRITPKIAIRQADGRVKFKEDDGRQITDDTHTLVPEMRIMHYQDPSTERWYHSFVPNSINKADDGMAWKYQIPTQDYVNELKVEA